MASLADIWYHQSRQELSVDSEMQTRGRTRSLKERVKQGIMIKFRLRITKQGFFLRVLQKTGNSLLQQCTDWTLTPLREPGSQQVPRISGSELSGRAKAGRRNSNTSLTVLGCAW